MSVVISGIISATIDNYNFKTLMRTIDDSLGRDLLLLSLNAFDSTLHPGKKMITIIPQQRLVEDLNEEIIEELSAIYRAMKSLNGEFFTSMDNYIQVEFDDDSVIRFQTTDDNCIVVKQPKIVFETIAELKP